MLRPGRGADYVKREDASRSRVSGHTDKNTRWKMGLVISGTVWHVTWQHFRGDLWLLLQLTYTSPFPAPHPPSQMGLPNGMAQGVYFRSMQKKKKVCWHFGLWQSATVGFQIFFLPQYWKENKSDIKSISGFKDGGARVKCMPLCVSVSETKIHESEWIHEHVKMVLVTTRIVWFTAGNTNPSNNSAQQWCWMKTQREGRGG